MKLNAYEKKKLTYIVAAVVFVLLAGIIYFSGRNTHGSDIAIESAVETDKGTFESSVETEVPVPETMVVHVSGAVAAPGVYEVGGSMRVGDAIAAAGGLKSNASTDDLNLARLLTDGEKITVLTKKQAKKLAKAEDERQASADDGQSSGESGQSPGEGGLVNINTASRDELMTLPGIGESKADAIIEYRESSGGFKKPEDLMEISGIKEGVFSKISGLITVK